MLGDAPSKGIVSHRCGARDCVHRAVVAERGKTKSGGRKSHSRKVVMPRWTASALMEPGRGRIHCRDHFRVSILRRVGAGLWALLCVSSWLMWRSLRAWVRMGARVLV